MLDIMKNIFKKKYDNQKDFHINFQEIFNYKFKLIDIIILNQFEFKKIECELIFDKKTDILLKPLNLKKTINLKPKKTYKLSYMDTNKKEPKKKTDKEKITEYFNNIDKQSQNIILVEKLLNKIYIILFNYYYELKKNKKEKDVFYKYFHQKLVKYCKEFNIKLKKIKIDDDSNSNNEEEKTSLTDLLSKDFENLFGDNIKN